MVVGGSKRVNGFMKRVMTDPKFATDMFGA